MTTMTSCHHDRDDSLDDVSMSVNTSVTEAHVLSRNEYTHFTEYFNTIKLDEAFTWKYEKDGCFARAHKMGEILQAKYGIHPSHLKKIWIGNSRGDLLKKWEYHVALVVVGSGGNPLNGMVIDPALFPDGPVTPQEWAYKCNNGSSNKSAVSKLEYYAPKIKVDKSGKRIWNAEDKVNNYSFYSISNKAYFDGVTTCVLTTIKNNFENWRRKVRHDPNSTIDIARCTG